MALINKGADVNGRDDIYHLTPLFFAAMRGQTEIVNALIAGGADLNYKCPIRKAISLRGGSETAPCTRYALLPPAIGNANTRALTLFRCHDLAHHTDFSTKTHSIRANFF